jgi:hypothetical protein
MGRSIARFAALRQWNRVYDNDTYGRIKSRPAALGPGGNFPLQPLPLVMRSADHETGRRGGNRVRLEYSRARQSPRPNFARLHRRGDGENFGQGWLVARPGAPMHLKSYEIDGRVLRTGAASGRAMRDKNANQIEPPRSPNPI